MSPASSVFVKGLLAFLFIGGVPKFRKVFIKIKRAENDGYIRIGDGFENFFKTGARDGGKAAAGKFRRQCARKSGKTVNCWCKTPETIRFGAFRNATVLDTKNETSIIEMQYIESR